MSGGLLQHHADLLRSSAISEEVATARGYRSVETKADLLALGFSRNQARTPALLLPTWGIDGKIASYQIRADEPRISRDGKPVKYETPAGSRMDLDVPPSCRPKLPDPKVPLFVTEGIRKGDAAASKGLCCIALLGVWNWRGTNDQGGKVALSAFEAIALNSRDVYIVFDSDAWTNPAVGAALRRLRDFLAGRGAHVHVIRLPAGPGGVKTGLDDYFADGHSVDDLLSLVSDQLPSEQADDDEPHLSYRSDKAGLIHERQTNNGTVDVRLTNFDARIVADIVEDDGVERQRLYEIEVTLGDRLPVIRVPVRSFSSMSWPGEHLGARAVVFPHSGDHARVAIQLLSGTPPTRTVFTSMGWREIDGQEVYLHAGGAIGPNGPVPGVEVRLDEPLSGFILPDPPEDADLHASVRASLDILDLAPDRISVALLAVAYRAALGAADLSGHITGPTGVFKTEVAALMQAHYGAGLDSRNLAASWSSTANANEDLQFRAKDALIVIDDFAPRGSLHEIGRANSEADRVMRAQGNRLGRQRMRADGSLRPPRPPRGLTLSTGEDVPRGASLVARMVIVDVGAGDIDVDQLTRCQADAGAGLYASAMSGFVRWLAQRGPSGRKDLQSKADALLEDLASKGQQHRRTPRNLMSLSGGLDAFLTFAGEVGAIDAVERERLWSRGLAAFRMISGMQDANQASENPINRFIELLRSAIASGKAHVAGADGERPGNPEAWGWRRDKSGSEFVGESWQSLGPRVGWVDGNDLYLLPDASYAAAQVVGRDVGDTISLRPRTLHKRLHEAGFLRSTEQGRGHLTVRRTLGGSRRDVLHLSALFAEPAQSAQLHQWAETRASAGPASGAGSPPDDVGSGPQARPETAHVEGDPPAKGTVGPNGPNGPISIEEERVIANVRHFLDAGGLIGLAGIETDQAEAMQLEQSARKDLRDARQPGPVGQPARDRLAAFYRQVARAIGADPADDPDGPGAREPSTLPGVPLGAPRPCPSCRLMHPAGTTCGWAAGPVGSQA